MTYQLAQQLGITLGLSVDTIQMIERQTSGGPALFAMEIVNTWLKKYPKETTEETFRALEENLRQVHLNYVIGKLRRNSQGWLKPSPHSTLHSIVLVLSYSCCFKVNRSSQ